MTPERRAAEAAARAEEAEFCRLLADGYLRTDAYGVIRKANGAAAELLHRPVWALEGKPLTVLVDADRRRDFRTLLNGLARAAVPQQWVLPLELAHGERLLVRATVSPIRDAGGALTGARWLVRRHVPPGYGDGAHGEALLAPPVPPVLDRSGHFAEFLARASAVLASSFDAEMTLRSVAHLAVPRLADWCIVDVVEPQGAQQGARRLAVTCAVTERHDPWTAIAAAAPPLEVLAALGSVEDPGAVSGHLEQPVSDEFLASVSADPAQLAAYGQLAPSGWLSVPLLARGNLLGVLTFVMAGSNRTFGAVARGVAEELAQRTALAADNARLYQAALRASQAKSDFLATMSHELRTPLTAIMGYTELLREGLAGPILARQDELLGRIRDSSDHLLGLVEEILGYARLEAREERALYERAEARALVDQAVTLVEPLARRKELRLCVEAPGEQLWFDTDVAKVRQMLVNLLGNAIKFTDSGEVRLLARREPDGAGGEHVVFEVRDTGIGIDPGQLQRVFDPFWQVDQRATRRHGGTGLGLSVVRQLARLLGGEVEAESEPGRGSLFRIRLPLRGQAAGEAAPGVGDAADATSGANTTDATEE